MSQSHAHLFTTAIATALCLIQCESLRAITVTEMGPLFDVEYDNASFIFQTGVTINEDGVEEPLEEQLGGYSIIDPVTIRYSLRPEETVPSEIDPTVFDIMSRGDIEVGGFPFLTMDMSSDVGAFRILPRPGQRISGVSMIAQGSFDNPTEEASLLYDESLTAGGESDSAGQSLGIFSAGAIPSFLATTFVETDTPVDVDFDFDLVGQSSDPVEISFAVINSIEFTVAVVPEPSSSILAILLLGVCVVTRRR